MSFPRARNALYYRRRYWYFRREAMKKYGDKCARCGYHDERALQFNHKNGDGIKERNRDGSRVTHDPREWLRQLVEQPLREDIELLCANCNWIYEYERGFRKGPPPDMDKYVFRFYPKALKKRMESKPAIQP